MTFAAGKQQVSTRKSYDAYIRSSKEAQLAAAVDKLAERFAQRAARHDKDGSFPFENFSELKQAGYLKLTVPKEYGGDEISLYELVLLQERLAKGDGSTALAVGWHMSMILHFRTTRHWPEPLFERLCRLAVEKGELYNGLFSEAGIGSPSRGAKPRTTAEKTEGGWFLSGRKTYSTLSPILNHFSVAASIAGEAATGEFYVDKAAGVRIEETWDTIGMRATGSHDLVLDRVFVPQDSLISRTEDGQTKQRLNDGTGFLLFIPACYMGIAYAARDYAVRFAKNYQPDSLNAPISQLPLIEQQIGLMEADLVTARNLLYSVADRWDKEPDNRAELKADIGLAKYVATNNAVKIVDRAMRIVGGTSLSRSLPLERMYRDIRAGLHNPPLDDLVLKSLAQRSLDEIE